MPAIEASDDPMIKLALAVDADARAVRKIHEDQVEGVETDQLRSDRQGPLRREGRRRLSRRDLHPSAGLRHRQGLRRSAAARSPRSPRSGAPSHHAQAHGNTPPYQLPKSWFTGPRLGQAQTRHAAQLRLDGRHHRRQFGQPGRQSRQRGRRPDLRRQHPVAGPRLRLRRQGRAPSRSTRAPSSRPCDRSITPIDW